MSTELDRLTHVLHGLQKHPDFDYCMTFEGNEEHHKSLEGWEANPALGRIEAHDLQSRAELYWMRKKET